MLQLEQELKNNAYPGRGIVIGRSDDGRKAAIAYFMRRFHRLRESKFFKFAIA